jgi:hypothetical protein
MVSGLKEAAEVAARNAEDKERAVAAAQQRVSELEVLLSLSLSLSILASSVGVAYTRTFAPISPSRPIKRKRCGKPPKRVSSFKLPRSGENPS